MPYNNTPIQPPKEHTGVVNLPLARVKKIIAADDDIASCSNNAAFVIAIAAEMFVQHLVEKTHEIIKAEKKPRRNVQYNDVANAVARLDNLEFLGDVVPRTTSYRKYKDERQRKEAAAAEAAAKSKSLPNGQTRIDGSTGHVRSGSIEEILAGPPGSYARESIDTNDADRMQYDPVRDEYRDGPSRQLDLEASSAAVVNGSLQRRLEQHEDVEME